MKVYEPHPLAELFPILSAQEMRALAQSIQANGLLHPIVLYEGKILDGRHRYDACAIAEVTPRFVQYKGKDPLRFVMMANVERRHMDTAQLAMLAARVETYNHGGDRKSEEQNQDANLHLDREVVAETLGISPRSVATASKILDASPSLAKQVSAGTLSLNAAEKKLAEKESKSKPVVDQQGWPIPEPLHEIWARRGEIESMLRDVASIKNKLLEHQENADCAFLGISYSGSIMSLQKAHQEISAARLYAVCTSCQGRNVKKCSFCKGRGILSKFIWDTAVPKETKDIRKMSLAEKEAE